MKRFIFPRTQSCGEPLLARYQSNKGKIKVVRSDGILDLPKFQEFLIHVERSMTRREIL
jgi:hypothetical protein